MNRPDFDWAFVRRHTLIPSLCALVAMLALGAAVLLRDGQQRLFSELHNAHIIVDKDYDALVTQRQIVNRYHRQYQRLNELGFIGQEDRLDWVETMRTTSESLKMSRLSYSIDPQLTATAPVKSILGGDNFEIRVSKLQLEMGLIHELELLQFFDELQKSAPGLLKVDTCKLTYTGDPQDHSADSLTASCAVQIFSLITSDVEGGVT